MKHLFLLFFLTFSIHAVDENQIYTAISDQIHECIAKNKFKDALTALKSFERQFPYSPHIPEIQIQKIEILINKLNRIDEGFYFIEHFKKSIISNKKISEIIIKFGPVITKKRLNRINYFLRQYFTQNLFFPKKLDLLSEKFKNLKNTDLQDGFGNNFIYELKKNPLLNINNELSYNLYSLGVDSKPNTEDDIYPDLVEISDNNNIFTVVDTFKDKDTWIAEIIYFQPNQKTKINKKIKENDTIGDYFVFGINENGVIFIKDNKLLSVKRI